MNEQIIWLRDDITCMRNILKSETDPAVRRECAMRIEANEREIKAIHDLAYSDPARHVERNVL